MNAALILSILSFLFGGGALLNLNKYIKLKQREQDIKINALMYGVQASLRDRLLQSYRYHESLGYMPYDEKESWLNSYSAYHSLGKNGVMDSIKGKVMEMPLKEESDETTRKK